MRGYFLRLLALSLFSTICEFLLPAGRVRRFAAPLLSLAVTAAVILPCFSLFREGGTSFFDLVPEGETVVSASFEAAVTEEYARRIEGSIEKQGDVDADVTVGENYSVSRIVLSGAVTTDIMAYITMELEVPRSRVEIR